MTKFASSTPFSVGGGGFPIYEKNYRRIFRKKEKRKKEKRDEKENH